MRRLTILAGIVALAAALMACGRSSDVAVPTVPPLSTSEASVSQQPAPAQQPQPASGEGALNRAAEVPPQLRGSEAVPPPPWPTFTPGPKPQSGNRLLYARTRRFYTANADGSDSRPLRFADKPPQLLVLSYKDPGRGWLAPNGRYLVYLAGQEAQLWRANLESLDNVLLAERMIPAGMEQDKGLLRALTDQEMAWTSDGGRVALLGAPDGVIDLFVVDVAAATLTRLTQDGLKEGILAWSPTGKHLAYMASDLAGGTQALYVSHLGAQSPAQIDMGPASDILGLAPSTSFSFAGQFTWLNDEQLAFYPSAGANARSVGIWVYDVGSGKVQPVVSEAVADFAWSAEARAWVYSTLDAPGSLWVIRLGDSAPRLLAEGEAYAPVWSPDGQLILYSWGDPAATGWDLRAVDLDGSTRTLAQGARLIERAVSQPGPAGKRFWDPNGQVVLFASVGRDYGRAERSEGYGGEAGPDLENWWAAPAEGGQPRQITDLQKTFYLQEPRLSPDGAVWAFIGFSYTDRMQHLYTMPRDGGHPAKVDAGVRWFEWLP